jgi:HPt (histidine-containing phosphotransfer) domain-containing protein
MQAIVDLFLTCAPNQLAAIERAIADDDVRALSAAAHTLTGAAANLGAESLADAARTLERIAIDARIDLAANAWETLAAAADDLFQALRTYRAASVEETLRCAP